MDGQVRVLVADNNRDVRQVLVEYVAMQPDMTVVGAAADGREALALIATARPDVVLLDIAMPLLDGLGVLERLQEGIWRPRPRVIVLTALGRDDLLRRLAELGADYSVVKPVDLEVLGRRIRQFGARRHPAAVPAAPAGAGACLPEGRGEGDGGGRGEGGPGQAGPATAGQGAPEPAAERRSASAGWPAAALGELAAAAARECDGSGAASPGGGGGEVGAGVAEAARAAEGQRWRPWVTELLHDLGVPLHMKGYLYLRDAVELVLEDDRLLAGGLTERIYPWLARRYGTSPSGVEAAIRNALVAWWERGDREAYRSLVGGRMRDGRIPTNSQMIAALAGRIRMIRYQRAAREGFPSA